MQAMKNGPDQSANAGNSRNTMAAPPRTEASKLARGLGWFSIGLGLAEVLMPNTLSRTLGMRGQQGLVRACGVRELAAGVGILTGRKRSPWLWSRVVGDAIDIAALAAHVHPGNPKRSNAAIALGSVAAVTALDIVTAKAETAHEVRAAAPVFDYSDRSGFPQSVEAMRGAAARDFTAPADMRTPEALRPTDSQAMMRPHTTTPQIAGSAQNWPPTSQLG